MINTYNESNLHSTLKKIYALENDGTCEAKIDGSNWIFDILCKNGNVIEIQTANLSALTDKVKFLLGSGRAVKIVHPIVFEKWIETLEENGDLKSRRKSPKKSTIYSALRGLTGISPLLGNEKLTIELVYVSVTEIRRATAEKVQTLNKSRRHLRNWLSEGKRLEKILLLQRFSGTGDWKKLFPRGLNEIFTRNELHQALLESDFLIPDLLNETNFSESNRAKEAGWFTLLIWLGKKIGILEEVKPEKKSRAKFFRLL